MIAVCGEALMDVIDGVATPGGGPFNTARALARLGVPVAFIGRLSDDEFGRELARVLEADGVSLALAEIGHEKTTIAVAEVDGEGIAKYRFEVMGSSAPQLTNVRLPEDVTAIHVGTLGLVLEPMASTLTGLVGREREGRLVMLDPNVRPGLVPDDVYRERLLQLAALSTIVKGSEADMAWLFPGLDHEAAAETLLNSGARLVVVTRGARGAFGAQSDCRASVDAIEVQVVDTIGAGDGFGAALLAWLHKRGLAGPDLLLDRAQLQQALEFASLAAAITCSRAGAEPPWRRELEAWPS